MMIAELDGDKIRPIVRRTRIIGLGRSLRETGKIEDREFSEAIKTLRSFRREMDLKKVESYRSCGTACLREASNRELFLSASREAGVVTEAIGPDEESRLVREGIRCVIPLRAGDIVMDIGGGSIEFSNGPGPGESISLPVGIVVLSTMLPLSDPPLDWEWKALSCYAKTRIEDATKMFGRGKKRRLIGTAGTFTTLFALEKRMTRYEPDLINGAGLSKACVMRWEKRLSGMTDRQRLMLPGMEKGRERYMAPGIVMIAAAINRFNVDTLTISDAGMLEGIIAGVNLQNRTFLNP